MEAVTLRLTRFLHRATSSEAASMPWLGGRGDLPAMRRGWRLRVSRVPSVGRAGEDQDGELRKDDSEDVDTALTAFEKLYTKVAQCHFWKGLAKLLCYSLRRV